MKNKTVWIIAGAIAAVTAIIALLYMASDGGYGDGDGRGIYGMSI